MENIYKNFEQQYPVNKTLRFELKPVGETSEYIRNNNLQNEDKDRAGDFERVKGILDRYYKNYISKNLKNLKLQDLKAYAKEYLSVSRDKKKLDSLAKHLTCREQEIPHLYRWRDELRKQGVFDFCILLCYNLLINKSVVLII